MAMRMQLSLPQRQMGVTSPSRNFSYPNGWFDHGSDDCCFGTRAATVGKLIAAFLFSKMSEVV